MCGCLARPLLGTWPTTQVCALTGNRTGDPLVHRPTLSPLSHTSQGSLFVFYTKLFVEDEFCDLFIFTLITWNTDELTVR